MLRNGQARFQLGDNSNLFDFTYITNAADAHILAAQALLGDKSDKVQGEPFFVSNDEPIYFWDFARAVWAHAGYYCLAPWKIPKELSLVLASLAEWYSRLMGREPGFTKARVMYACVSRYYSIERAKTLLGYEPAVSLADGIRDTLAWLDSVGALAGTTPPAIKKTQ